MNFKGLEFKDFYCIQIFIVFLYQLFYMIGVFRGAIFSLVF